MHNRIKNRMLSFSTRLMTLAVISYAFVFIMNANNKENKIQTSSYIVQGADLNIIDKLVNDIGGEVTHRLAIIQAVGAKLTPSQQLELSQSADVKLIFLDRSVKSSGRHHSHKDEKSHKGSRFNSDLEPDVNYAKRVRADRLHDINIDGYGITIAFIDTGFRDRFKFLKHDTSGKKRVLAKYNAIKDKLNHGIKDESGHGTHIISVALSSEWQEDEEHYAGVAPMRI